MFKKLINIMLFCYWIIAPVKAQQQAIYSQFTVNKYLYNPAAAGSDNISSVKLTGHEQWVGFSGAPKYNTATYDGRIFQDDHRPIIRLRKKEKKPLIKPGSVGIGFQLFNESTGPLGLSGLNATYAYHESLGASTQLSFGLSFVFVQYKFNSKDAILADEQYDKLINGGNTTRYITDFNFGAMVTGKNYFAGYSATQLLQSSLQFGIDDGGKHRIKRTHYLMGGYSYEINEDYVFEPAVLLKFPEALKAQLDLNLKMTIKKDYWCGLIFRTGSSLSIFGGMKYDRYFFGYCFDYNLNDMRKYSYGSHEIVMGVQLGTSAERYKWLNTY
jgi:type IX secretion system PorP/SprF family membrane protein